MKHKIETIKLAAVQLPDVYYKLILTGKNHADIIWTVSVVYKESEVKVTQNMQGFVTSEGRFVNRREAAEIAYIAKQITKRKKELFSEDINI